MFLQALFLGKEQAGSHRLQLLCPQQIWSRSVVQYLILDCLVKASREQWVLQHVLRSCASPAFATALLCWAMGNVLGAKMGVSG